MNIGGTDSSFLDHLEALRRALWRSVAAIAVFLIPGVFAAMPALEWLVRYSCPAEIKLNYFTPMEPLLVQLKLGLILAVIAAMPVILYQLAGFVAPGLYEHERRACRRVIWAALGLFLAGASLGLFLVTPLMMRFSAQFASEALSPVIGIGGFVNLVGLLTLSFGIMFQLPVVMVSPSDTSLVSESGEERRKFVNSVLSQMDREYLSAVQQYNRLLLQRNRALKSPSVDRELLVALDLGMGRHAAYIHEARKRFVSDISPIVSGYYRELSGGKEDVSVSYRSDLDGGPLEDLLARSFDRDSLLGFTSAGVHRDDFVFAMDAYPIRRCGSQGQQKSFLVSLKFAQYDIMKKSYGFAPTLLLDDVFDKLDMNRISNLLSMVTGNDFGQIFITDCNKVRMSALVDRLTDDRAYFECAAGSFTRQ